jgi:hypothetical protein
MTTCLLYVAVLAAGSVTAEGIAAEPTVFESSSELSPQGRIDELVLSRLQQLGLQPARICSDGVFVRRVFLDVIGTLPTAQEAREFLQDQDPDKRRTLIDRLLLRGEFADYWAMKWSDLLRVKAEFPINLWPNAAQAYHRWIHTSIQQNRPYDQFVRDLLTANGSNFRVGQVNFYRAVQDKTPQGLAQAVALTFLGARADKWPPDRLAGMAAFFSQISYTPTGEWKEEIVSFNPATPGTEEPPASAIFPDGTPVKLQPDEDPRVVFADWLIRAENPWFARPVVNRAWCWLLGRGIIHEPDDIRPDNAPSNPELLAFLEQEFIASKYDLRHLYRLILNSQTYQLSSVARSDKPEAAANFAYYPLRRLDAEVLIDAVNQITGTSEEYSSAVPEPFTYMPEGQRAVALPDGSITSPFLEMFGRPARDTGLESERSNRPTADQRLHLLNSSHIQRKIENSPKLQALLAPTSAGRPAGFNKAKQARRYRYLGIAQDPRGSGDAQSTETAVTSLYLTFLSRFPTQTELTQVTEYAKSASSAREALTDVVWALLNSAEFLYRH